MGHVLQNTVPQETPPPPWLPGKRGDRHHMKTLAYRRGRGSVTAPGLLSGAWGAAMDTGVKGWVGGGVERVRR